MNELQKPAEAMELITSKLDAITKFAAMVYDSESLCPGKKERVNGRWEFKKEPLGDITLKIIFGMEAGLGFASSLHDTYVINRKVTAYGDALLALALAHPACEYINETFDPEANAWTCEAKRKGHAAHRVTFSYEEAEHAGLTKVKTYADGGKAKDGVWQLYPKRMLQMRARSWAIRDKFADGLYGMRCYEEVMDYPEQEDLKDITPKKSMDSIPIDVTPLPARTTPKGNGMTAADYKRQEADAMIKTHDDPIDPDEDIPDLTKPKPKKDPQTPELSPRVELERELLRRVVDTSKFYKHYKISKISELTEEQAKNALKALKKKPLKEITGENNE
jgi:hypothetical protein